MRETQLTVQSYETAETAVAQTREERRIDLNMVI